jgi:5-oxoprolinase (ATP-hydrolysing)
MRTHSKGGPLAVTDANLVLGRLVLDTFPSIFGPTEKEPLDADASLAAFEKLAARINAETGSALSVDEIVYGFIDVANESMARPIRTLTDARGHAAADHMCVRHRCG